MKKNTTKKTGKSKITKFNLTQNKKVIDRSKKLAKYFLKYFKWDSKQEEILKSIAKKGYSVRNIGVVSDTFNWSVKPTNSSSKGIFVVSTKSTSPVSRKNTVRPTFHGKP